MERSVVEWIMELNKPSKRWRGIRGMAQRESEWVCVMQMSIKQWEELLSSSTFRVSISSSEEQRKTYNKLSERPDTLRCNFISVWRGPMQLWACVEFWELLRLFLTLVPSELRWELSYSEVALTIASISWPSSWRLHKRNRHGCGADNDVCQGSAY